MDVPTNRSRVRGRSASEATWRYSSSSTPNCHLGGPAAMRLFSHASSRLGIVTSLTSQTTINIPTYQRTSIIGTLSDEVREKWRRNSRSQWSHLLLGRPPLRSPKIGLAQSSPRRHRHRRNLRNCGCNLGRPIPCPAQQPVRICCNRHNCGCNLGDPIRCPARHRARNCSKTLP